jgi:two-component system, OmpR family, sensor histidine kinase KdpD
MKKIKGRMDESILVCVYYGPNGERLIQRGCKIANMLDCPLYILTVDPTPFSEMDAEKSHYISKWKQIGDAHGADSFILMDNEKRPISKVIAQVAREKQVTQIILGQTAQSRWEQLAKGSIINSLLKEVPFVDLHIVSVSRYLREAEGTYEKGVRAYLVQDQENFRVIFKHTKDVLYDGIFFKEQGTDFNTGVFKFMKDNQMLHVQVTDDFVVKLENVDMELELQDEEDQ